MANPTTRNLTARNAIGRNPHIERALELHRQGHFERAAKIYRNLLLRNDKDAYLHQILGVALYQMGRYEDAHRHLTSALLLRPNYPEAYTNLGLVLAAVKRHEHALICHQRATDLRPDFAQAWVNRGGSLRELWRLEEALHCYERACALDPDLAPAFLNRGAVLLDLEKVDEARLVMADYVKRWPDDAAGWQQYGNACLAVLDYDAAAQCFARARQLSPRKVSLLVDCARLELARGNVEQAQQYADMALAIDHQAQFAHRIKALLMFVEGNWESAKASYDRAIELDAADPRARVQRAAVALAMGNRAEALDDLDVAIRLWKDYADAYRMRADLLRTAQRYDESISDWDRVLSIKPSDACAKINLIYELRTICDWERERQSGMAVDDSLLAVLDEKTVETISPFIPLALSDRLDWHRQLARAHWERTGRSHLKRDRLPLRRVTQGERIRVGYFSADFHQHATMLLMAELFELHDRERFEWVAFSFGPRTGDAMQRRAQAAFDRFIDVRDRSPLDIARLARELEIDIAVDLKGYTQDARTGIFANRAAPIQVNYLGYPGTMGVDFYDYIVADPVVIPDELRCCYSEKVVRLPHSYQVNDRQRRIAERVFMRAECGLPELGVVYACFNATYKITPEIFATWMRILDTVPGSVLWLYEDNRWAPDNLRREAARHGVDPQRLVFAPPLPNADHLARLRLADLFLDTLPYNAHTTASDALWAGLPVLTRIGQSFAARVAASLLTAVGMPELIVHTPEDYEAMAVSLGREPDRLAQLRRRLLAARETAPLWDTPRWARHLEAAFRAMYERAAAALPPAPFDVRPDGSVIFVE